MRLKNTCVCEYDENGNPVSGTYYDADGPAIAKATASYLKWDKYILERIAENANSARNRND